MSHELDDNKERREHILAKIRQHQEGVSATKLHTIIMELEYFLRGAKEKVKELKYMGLIKEHNFRWYDHETYSQLRKREKKEDEG